MEESPVGIQVGRARELVYQGLHLTKLVVVIAKVQGRRPKRTEKIIEQKFLWPPECFQCAPKHDERKHIEENMGNATMHEEVRGQLKRLKQAGPRIVEGQQIDHLLLSKQVSGQKKQHIDDQKIFDYAR